MSRFNPLRNLAMVASLSATLVVLSRLVHITSSSRTPTILYEDNTALIAQLKGGYIKGDRTNHISPKFFFIHDLEKCGDIDVQQICSKDNLADLFTKVLPTTTFEGLQCNIGMRRLKDMR
jgi:hypothetical protein